MPKWNKLLGRAVLERWYDYSPDKWSPDTIRKAVIFTPKAIGDGMGIYPVIRALQSRRLDWLGIVASEKSAPIFEALKEEGVELLTVKHDRDYPAVKRMARNLRSQHGHIDLCVDATAIASSPAIYFVGTLKARMNLQVSGSRMRAYAPLGEHVRANWENIPTVQSWACLMKEAGIGKVPGRFELPIPAHVDDRVKTWADSIGNYLLFNLDGSADERRISLDKAREILPAAHEITGVPIVLPYDPQGAEKAKQLANEFPFVSIFPEGSSVLISAALVKHAAFVFSPDTAIVHIASAYNRPTIGVYLTDNKIWHPQAQIKEVIQAVGQVEQPLTQKLISEKPLSLKQQQNLLSS